jgi:hypothetical protein
MGIKNSLPCSLKPANRPQPQTDEPSPHPPFYAWVLYLIQVSPSKFCKHLFSRIVSTHPAHLVLQHLSTQIIFGETYE